MLENINSQIGTYLPGILSALAILIIGWIVAHIVGRLVRLGLKKSGLDSKLSSALSPRGGVNIAAVAGKVAYYLIMLFVLIAFFNALNLPVVSQPLNAFLDQIFLYAPRVISGAVLGIVAYVLARLGKEASKRGLEAVDIDARIKNIGTGATSAINAVDSTIERGLNIGDDEVDFSDDDDDLDLDLDVGQNVESKSSLEPSTGDEQSEAKLSQTLPEAVYWVIIALFLPAILGALQIPGLLEPVQNMFNKAMSYLPNIVGAVVILLIGLLIAKIVKQVISNLASSFGINSMAAKVGINPGQTKVSDLLGILGYAVVIFPILVQSLKTLNIEAISGPAAMVLERITSLIPGFIGAAVVLAIAVFVGRLVGGIVTDLLAGVGFDEVPAKIGLNLNTSGGNSPSHLGGKVVMFAIVLLSALQALPMMGLGELATYVETFAGFAVNVLMACVILGAGLYLGNFVAKLIKDSGVSNGDQLGLVARAAIGIFAGGFALQEIGLSASIINVAFGSLLGGLGLAAAIAFGWGGRDAAKRIVDRFVK
jgi:hypothetical protein